MKLVLATAVALLVVLAAAGPSAAREQSNRCYPRGAEDIATGTRARLFRTEDAEQDVVIYACDLLTGRRTLLADLAFDQDEGYRHIRFAGRVIAFARTSCSGRTASPTEDPCSDTVETLDVHTRRRVGAGVSGVVEDIVVLPNGAAAWTERAGAPDSPEPRSVKAISPEFATRELDAGPSVAPDSLALSADRRVYWRNGAEARAFKLAGRAPVHSAPEPRGRRSCFPRRSTTLAATTRVRVFTIGDGSRTIACDLRRGRRTELPPAREDMADYRRQQLRIAGTLVATAETVCSRTVCGSGGAIRVFDASGAAPSRLVEHYSGEASILDLTLDPSGAVAWVDGIRSKTAPTRTRAIRRCDSTGCATLATGDDLARVSLGLSAAGDLYWRDDGVPRSARLSRATPR